jgi:hypothetical protein
MNAGGGHRQIVCGTEDEPAVTLFAVNGSTNHLFFQLPPTLTPGICKLSLFSCGKEFPLADNDGTITIVPTGTARGVWAAARSQATITVNTTTQLFAALNISAEQGGAVILLSRGTYEFTNESIDLPHYTTLRGVTTAAGSSLVTLRWDVRALAAADVPAFFVGGQSTFAVEDVTIYTLGLYNRVIADNANHQSSYVRIARVCIRADYFFRWGRGEAACILRNAKVPCQPVD